MTRPISRDRHRKDLARYGVGILRGYIEAAAKWPEDVAAAKWPEDVVEKAVIVPQARWVNDICFRSVLEPVETAAASLLEAEKIRSALVAAMEAADASIADAKAVQAKKRGEQPESSS